MKFWNIAENAETGEPELHIDGQIQMDESIWAWLLGKKEQTACGIRTDIKRLDGRDITVWINSNGGECFAASVIYTALKEHHGKVTVKVDGMAISAASVIAMAGDELLMSPTAVMMIHNPLTVAEGEVKDMQKAIDILTEVKETVINAYCKKCKKSRAEISALMDAETWMGAQKAIDIGFADGLLYDDAQTGGTVNDGRLQGVQMVYNSLGMREVDTGRLLALLKQSPEDGREQALAMIEIETKRFGGMTNEQNL